MDNIGIFSLNVRGLRAKSKRKSVFTYLKQKKFDIICLQETHITNNVSEEWKREWKSGFIYHEGTPHSLGQIILFSEKCSEDSSVIISTERILAVKTIIKNKPTIVVNIYAPQGKTDKESLYNEITSKIVDINHEDIILCGDFNCVMDNKKDIVAGEIHNEETVESLNNMINTCDLYDTWRLFNENTKEYTWSRKKDFVARRLDYIFVSNSTLSMVTESTIHSVPFSDHRGCLIRIQDCEIIRGKGYWKFNNSLLEDQKYVNQMNTFIEEFNEEGLDAQLSWELLKIRIKEFTIDFCKNKNQNKKNKTAKLYNELNNVDMYLSNNPNSVDAQNKREEIKLKLELIEAEKARAAQIRSRIKWIEEGEKSTKYFLGLEKARANSKLMDHVKDENEHVLTNQSDIQRRQRDYFENLYKKRIDDNNMEDKIDDFTRGCNVPQLLRNQAEACDKQLTENELLESLKGMNNGSAPGSDGITAEFLKVFWSRIKNHLLQSFNISLVKGNLSISQRSAIITLIHKGKDLPRNEMKNWRPISLTNSDYKLLAKCLALRMNNVIEGLINPDQVGYIKGRQSSTILRLIDDVTEQMNINNKPGLLATIDMFHAFDCISKEFMLKTFRKFGFGPVFVSWIELLMKNTRSCINYAGWLSSYFPVESGIRQGCPFSPLAFVLALELLAIKIRQSPNVKGLPFYSICRADSIMESLKIALYADDVTLFLADENDLRNVLFIFSLFKNVSGLELNILKCEAMWLGSNKNRQDSYFNFKWKNKIKILGVYFSNNESASNIKENLTDRVAKIKRLISAWEKRDLSIMGKIIIVKTFLLSQLVYFMQAFIIPDKYIVEINTILFRFIWKKKNNNKKAFEKVKRNVMCTDYQEGGLKMIDLRLMQTSFILQWATLLTSSEDIPRWKIIPKAIFLCHGPSFECFHSTVTSKRFKGIGNIKSAFWAEVLKTFLDCNTSPTNDKFNPMLWNNTNFMFNNNVMYFQEWAMKGIVNVHDMLHGDECKSYISVCETLGHSPNRILEYVTVRSVVTKYIKENNRTREHINLKDTPLFCGNRILRASQFRKTLTELRAGKPCSVNFWKNKFNYNITKQDWRLAPITTKETRLRVLQWKILHNIYPTNIMLCKMKVTENNYCSYCNGEVDFIEHFFFYCPFIKNFWKDIENLIRAQYGMSIQLGVTDVLFGIHSKTERINAKTKNALNNIILIGKMCISIFKKTKRHASIYNLFEGHMHMRIKST